MEVSSPTQHMLLISFSDEPNDLFFHWVIPFNFLSSIYFVMKLLKDDGFVCQDKHVTIMSIAVHTTHMFAIKILLEKNGKPHPSTND